MHKKTFSITCLCASLLAACNAHAQITLTPQSDTYINSGQPDTSYGSDDNLRVRSSAGVTRKSFVRFDLSSVPSPVDSAELVFTMTEDVPASDLISGLGLTLWVINDLAAGDALADWSDTMTWNSNDAPGDADYAQNDGSTTGMDAGATALQTIDVSGGFTQGDTISFGSSIILSPLQDDTNGFITFALTYADSGEGTSLKLASSENASFDGPELNLTAGVVPEPGTYALIAGIVVLAAARLMRRRRG